MGEQQTLGSDEPPDMEPTALITHPNKPTEQIGKVCYRMEEKGGGVVTATGEKVAVLFRHREEHYFRKYSGYAVSLQVLDALEKVNVSTVFIHERERKKLLEYSVSDFREGTELVYDTVENTTLERLPKGGENLRRYDVQFVSAEEEAEEWEEYNVR